MALSAMGCATLVGARPVRADGGATTTFHVVAVGDEQRGFLLHRPPARGREAMPVFFVLHGSSANANVAMEESGMNEIADSLGALAVYPNGTGGIPYIRLFWNFEDCCGPQHRRPDEAAMIRTVLDTLAHHFAVDSSRIGVIGFSDAGTLVYEIACLDAATVAAIGVISGEVPERRCTPAPPVPTVVFHGTADSNIRYGNTAENVARWAEQDGCSITPVRVDTAGVVVRSDHSQCSGGSEVTLYTIVGGQHAWPGGRASWRFAPQPSQAIDASRVFAAFVMSHPRQRSQ